MTQNENEERFQKRLELLLIFCRGLVANAPRELGTRLLNGRQGCTCMFISKYTREQKRKLSPINCGEDTQTPTKTAVT